jgi:hypothetical protein
MDGKLPIDVEFDQGAARAWIEFTSLFEQIPHPEEYFIAPMARYDDQKKKWIVEGYSFVHVSHLPTEKQLMQKMYNVSGEQKYLERSK